ncbi:MAG: hypothetical protein ACXWUG_25715 [Polyangiales bacterium]
MSVALDLAVAQDFAYVASDAPCTQESQLHGGWSCFRARGDQYHGTPRGGRVPGSVALGTSRLMLGAELQLDGFAFGARASWSFRGLGPASDGMDRVLPFGGELFARVALTSSPTFQLDFLGMVGARILDAHASDKIAEDTSVPPPAYQLDNPDTQTLDAYKRMGTGFVGAGLAATFKVAEAHALRFELPISIFFPSSGVAFSPTLAWVVTL